MGNFQIQGNVAFILNHIFKLWTNKKAVNKAELCWRIWGFNF